LYKAILHFKSQVFIVWIFEVEGSEIRFWKIDLLLDNFYSSAISIKAFKNDHFHHSIIINGIINGANILMNLLVLKAKIALKIDKIFIMSPKKILFLY
jgi:hypothetical protein